jgi:hypothetical protein
MKKDLIAKLHASSEHAMRVGEHTGVEFWLARDLQ